MGIESKKPVAAPHARTLTRRRILAAAPALPLFGIISGRGWAARPKYRFKYASNLPMTHPINQRVKELERDMKRLVTEHELQTEHAQRLAEALERAIQLLRTPPYGAFARWQKDGDTAASKILNDRDEAIDELLPPLSAWREASKP